jgi:K+-transporting ATPase ATPase C chain
MNLIKHIYPAIAMTVVLTVLTGILYPYAITGLAYVLFKDKAQGSLIVRDGKVVGSRLIGQPLPGQATSIRGLLRRAPAMTGRLLAARI